MHFCNSKSTNSTIRPAFCEDFIKAISKKSSLEYILIVLKIFFLLNLL